MLPAHLRLDLVQRGHSGVHVIVNMAMEHPDSRVVGHHVHGFHLGLTAAKISTVIEKKNNRSVLMPACASEPCGVLTVLMFLPLCCVSKIGIVVGTVATGDMTSQPYARLFRGEFADDRQPKKFVLIGLIHQDDPDPKASKHENQHQRQSD